jgi:MSHA pilin protein MshD
MKAAAYPNILNIQGSKGFSLIELIISIVVLGIALGALSSSLFLGVGRSADPLWQSKMTQVSQAYLDGISSMRYQEDSPLGGGSVGTCSIDGKEDGEIDRSLFDDVDDYHNYDESVEFLDNTTPANYAGYKVKIGVTCDDVVVNSKLITVTISSPAKQNIVFSVIRGDL